MATKSGSTGGTRRKRRGLRLFLTLLILLGAGGTAFWFGLLSVELDEGEYGVVFTKLNGYEDNPVSSGEFAWRWEALLPTNLTLHVFELETRTVPLTASGKMPSGMYYGTLVGEGVDFGWRVTARVRYRLNPKALPGLVAEGLAGSGLEGLYAEYEALVEKEMGRIMEEQGGGSPEASSMERLRAVERELSAGIAALDDRMEVLDVSVLDWTFPDMALYAEARRLALDLMERRRDVIAEVEDAALRRQDAQDEKIVLLDRYGEVLDRYPILLDLFSLEGNPGASLLPEAPPAIQ